MTAEPDSHVGGPFSLDELDHRLIEELLGDARLGNRALAARLTTSEATVSVRLRRMTTHGVLVFTAVVDWEAAGYEWFAIARIGVHERPPADVAAEIADIPDAIAVALVFGTANVLAFFLLDSRSAVQRMLQDDLTQIKGVADVSIDLAIESFVTKMGAQWFMSKRTHAVELPQPVIPLDEVDLGVVKALIADGRQSSRRIGRALGVSEGTVRARMIRLTNAGLLRPVAMVDPLLVGTATAIANIDVRARAGHDARAVMQAILQMPMVVFAAIVVGTADLSITVAAVDRRALHSSVYAIRGITGVASAETLEIFDFVKFVPHYKRLADDRSSAGESHVS